MPRDSEGDLKVEGISANTGKRNISPLALPKISSKWVSFGAMMLKRKKKRLVEIDAN